MKYLRLSLIVIFLSSSLQINAKISERNRYQKTWSTVLGWGLGLAPLATIGGSLGYYITPNLLAELGLYRGAGITTIGETKGNLSWRYTEARTKWFVGNSFYLNMGLGQKTVDVNLEFLDSPSSLLASGLSYGIGNRWQWETFSLGCDWLGAFRPLQSEVNRTEVTKDLSVSDNEDWDQLWAAVGSPANLQIFRLYMGVSF